MITKVNNIPVTKNFKNLAKQSAEFCDKLLITRRMKEGVSLKVMREEHQNASPFITLSKMFNKNHIEVRIAPTVEDAGLLEKKADFHSFDFTVNDRSCRFYLDERGKEPIIKEDTFMTIIKKLPLNEEAVELFEKCMPELLKPFKKITKNY